MRRQLLAVSIVSTLATGCSTFGPKANVSVISSEIKNTKTVENIIIPNTSGIDSSGNTGKALLASAIGAYGKRARPLAVASAVLSTAGAPAGLGDLLTGSYQAEFIKAVDSFVASKGEKKPESIKLPSSKLDFEVPSGLEGVKTLVSKISGESKAVLDLSKALQTGDNAGFVAGIEKSKTVMAIMQKVNDFVFESLGVTYVLVTHVAGNEGDWEAGKKVQFFASLVNIKTGNLRYFASVEAEKGMIPTPFMAQISMMSANLFAAVNEQDALPATQATAIPTPKKTAFIYYPGLDSH